MQFFVELEEPMYRKMMKAVWNGSEFHVLKLVAVMLLLYVGVRRFWKRRTVNKDDRHATMILVDGTADSGGDVSCPDDRGRFGCDGGNYGDKVSRRPEGMVGSV